MVQLPGRGPIPFGPAALTKNLPEPFKAEWTGGGGIHMHHKFVICDFNGGNPVVFTGSSTLAAGGDEGNGDNRSEMRDAKVVSACGAQAASRHCPYRVRNRMTKAETKPAARGRAEPPAPGKPAWWEASLKPDDYNCRDRPLSAG